MRFVAQGAAALAVVALVSWLLSAVDADRTVAALVLVLVGVMLTFLGSVGAVVGIAACFASLNYFFTPPDRTFEIGKVDDLVALVVLVVTTTALGTTISRANRLRRRADLREREIRTRLELSNRLADGASPASIVDEAGAALRTLFGQEGLRLHVAEDGHLRLELDPAAAGIEASDREEVAAFVIGLDTALERTRLAAEVQAARVAAAIEESRAGFLAAMTHNLRTPLATIKAALSALRRSPVDGGPGGGLGGGLDPAAARDLVGVAYGELERLERLVAKVLALSRIRSGALTAAIEPVDLAEVVQVAVQRLSILAADREVVLDVAPDLRLVAADPALLDVALVNLLENALRYAPEGPIVVRGRMEGATAVLDVDDEGEGIATEDRERAFEEFVRLDHVRDPTGTGIGLTIARAFVAAQGGTITLAARPHGGTRARIALPPTEGARP
jgi:two-component system sensor histidine kinase KdpD